MIADLVGKLHGRTLLFLVTEDFYFESHRLPLALAARDAGMRVVLATRVGNRTDALREHGFEVLSVPFERGGLNPVRDLELMWHLISIYRRLAPDIVHHVAMKPVIYGSIAARVIGTCRVVNALAGLGFVFSSQRLKARFLRPVVGRVLRYVLSRPGSRLILQNRDDVAMFERDQWVAASGIRLVPGVGVDLQRFAVKPEPPGRVRVTLPARMLVDKGVLEFVDAARLLKQWGIEAECELVGGLDMQNPACIPEDSLRSWQDEGVVTWRGHTPDMPSVFAACHIVCLPSYREGLPKALLEACASGRPIVATDVPGCRDVVRDGENGLLVHERDAADLAEKLAQLIVDASLRHRMGQAGRAIAEREYSVESSVAQTLGVYMELI
jgi:glycosyltransferase involved in cell wall biosynthesis